MAGVDFGNATERQRAILLTRRLVAQWLSIHGFLAKEGLQTARIASAASAADDLEPAEAAAARRSPTLASILAQMERGWNLVTDSQVRVQLVVPVSGDRSYMDNDYRPSAAPPGEQDIPLPVSFLEVAALHLDVLTEYLREQQMAVYDECRLAGTSALDATVHETASRTFRYAQLAEASARTYYNRTVHRYPSGYDSVDDLEGVCDSFGGNPLSAGQPAGVENPLCFVDGRPRMEVAPTWQARWDVATLQYDAALQRALAASTALADCANPLQLPEREVPLYFGDVSGTSSRFFAASDYLLSGWAKPAVERASAALAAARDAWSRKRDSAIQEVMTLQDAERRHELLAAQYGQQVIDLCGLRGVPAKDAIAQVGALSEAEISECHIEREAPECAQFLGGASGVQATQTWTWASLVRSNGSALAANSPCQDEDGPSCQRENTCRANPVDEASVKVAMCVYNDVWKLDPDKGRKEHVKRAAAAYQDAVMVRDAECNQIKTVSAGGEVVGVGAFAPHAYVSQARIEIARAYCTDSDGKYEESYEPDLTSHAACFRGQLGEEVLALIGARQDIEMARDEWRDAQALYDISAKHCDRMEVWNIELETLTRDHEETMRKWELARGLTDIAINTVASYYTMNVQGGVDVLRSSVGMVFAGHMDLADRVHRRKMRAIERESRLYECYAEARKVVLRIDNAARTFERAIIEADRHIVKLRDMRASLRNVLADGSAAMSREQGRVVPSLSFHYWLDERIDTFHKDFQWAKALTYLAMTAVEYEYQQSMQTRDDIMQATHPDQLADAIRQMEQTQISRTINGRRPEDAKIVRSLATDILGLTALETERPGERTMTALERFQQRLWSPRYAMYDDDGAYLGQGIPFSVEPAAELLNACAERVWAVTATVQGDTLNQTEPGVPLTVLKRNNFSSQWCSGKSDGTSLQNSAVQPVSQLFHPEDRGGDEAAVNHYTSARVWPWFNVPRSEFYRDAYGEGSSTELAGQGLYGEYVLLFPADGLLREGFPLEKVEDVLLRFDYLSVDDLRVPAGFGTSETEH
jgi:hypothetical protein